MRIAVIGGIGCGKSEFVRIAKDMGIACVSADEINAQLLEDEVYIAKIKTIFPNAVKNGKIDKAELSAEVFSNKEKRKKLNSIAHPEIMLRIASESADPLIVELPLVIESGAQKYFDEIILVSTPILTRIKRLKINRNVSVKKAISIINAQVSEKQLKKIATRIVKNTGSKEDLKEKATALFDIICKRENE